ncbi:MAG: sel1 repeat family protein [Myxococcales bacterium]|nr:sel1 repeat family protein [Myxococcales bacterium]
MKQCSYRFTKSAAAHKAEVETHEQASKKAAEGSKGVDELAAGERAAKSARDSRDQAEALRHFAASCDSGNAEGCARAAEFSANGWGTKPDIGRAIRLTAKACKLGRGLSCTDDLGCVERREVAIVGKKVSRNSMRVTKSVGVETIKKCERHCASGLPGACHTAGNYQSAAGRDAEAKRSFGRSCKLGNKGDCG